MQLELINLGLPLWQGIKAFFTIDSYRLFKNIQSIKAKSQTTISGINLIYSDSETLVESPVFLI
jgi:hypothetical protein